MQKVVILFMFVAAAGCCTAVDRRPVLETGLTSSPVAESADATPTDEAALALATEQAAEDTRPPDAPGTAAEVPANQPLERVEWTHNRRHFKKWREEIREMHRDFDRTIFELEAAGKDGTGKEPKRHLPFTPHPTPQQ